MLEQTLNRLKAFIALVFFFASLATMEVAPAASEKRQALLQEAIASELSCYPLPTLSFLKQEPILEFREFCLASIYDRFGNIPLWVEETGPTNKGWIIYSFLKQSWAHGLDPKEYQIEIIAGLWLEKGPEQLARLDLLLSYNLVKYIHDLSYGRLKIYDSYPSLFAEAANPAFNPVKAMEAALLSRSLVTFLRSLAPDHRYYTELQEALLYYGKKINSSAFITIATGPLIRPGADDPRIPAIKQILATEGFLTASAGSSIYYDQELVTAITAFQKRHGLKDDGVIGPQTVSMLNLTPPQKIEIIKANLARWRWQAHVLGANYVMVNIAAFSLEAVENGKTSLKLPVIVGKKQHQTPVFSDSIEYLELHPFWNIPPSIARNEKLPALREDPNHLVNNNIRLFSSWQADAIELDSTGIDWQEVSPSTISGYHLRQEPGPNNALGQVKFVFPNQYSVYLHDTPAKELFSQSRRSFSHGCIRVGSPLELASFALRVAQPDFDQEELVTILHKNQRRIFRLKEKLPVHITYQTVWVDKNGDIHFSNDIYDRDARLLAVLQSP